MQGNFVPRFLSYSYLRGNEVVCNEDQDVCEGGRSLITSQVNNGSKEWLYAAPFQQHVQNLLVLKVVYFQF